MHTHVEISIVTGLTWPDGHDRRHGEHHLLLNSGRSQSGFEFRLPVPAVSGAAGIPLRRPAYPARRACGGRLLNPGHGRAGLIGESHETKNRATLALAAMLDHGGRRAGSGQPASATYKPQPFHLVCGSGTNGGTLQGSVCALPAGVTTPATSYSATITSVAGGTTSFAVASGSLPPGLALPGKSTSGIVVITGSPPGPGCTTSRSTPPTWQARPSRLPTRSPSLCRARRTS